MGPGPDGPGKPLLPFSLARLGGGFNGAGAGWPRKTAPPYIINRIVAKLQWGRGRMAPENRKGSHFREEVPGWLQWGRGRMAPEN